MIADGKDKAPVARGSAMFAFKNGEPQVFYATLERICSYSFTLKGLMFENVPESTYYPAVSLYMGAKVKVNFGPTFHFPPNGEVRPVSDAVYVTNAHLVMGDLLAKVCFGLFHVFDATMNNCSLYMCRCAS